MNKFKYIQLTLVIVIMIAGMSCKKFLDVNPESKIPDSKIFADEKTTNAYVLGLYDNWREIHKPRVDPYLGTDEASVGGFQHDDFERRGIEEYGEGQNSTNGKIREIWTNRFQIIARSAAAVTELKKNESTNSAELNKLLAEASFLRAVSSWELSMYFGGIPVKDTDKPEYGGRRQTLPIVLAAIEEDLLRAEKYLPDPSEITDQRRVSKALAQAVLGKLYLYAATSSGFRDYEKAASYFKKVIDNPFFGGKGASNVAVIYDAYQQNSADYLKEMVYAFQYKAGWPNQSSAEWDLGSRAVAQMTPTEALAPYSGFDGMIPTAYSFKMVADGGVWEEGDLRKDESVRYDFKWQNYTPNMNGWVWGDELDPHIKKYEDPRTVDNGQNTWHSGKNIPFIRFSDVVLCYAECLYKTGQQGEAIRLVNDIVRKRAFGGALPADKAWPASMDETTFYKNLMDERLRELCFEGWRKFDLLRTGLLKEYVTKRNRWMIGGDWTNVFGTTRNLGSAKVIEDYKLLWPIPLEELRQNPDLSEEDQNPGYAN